VETFKEADLTTLSQSPEDRSLCSHPQENLNSQSSSGSAFAASLSQTKFDLIFLESGYICGAAALTLEQGCTNSGHHVAVATKFFLRWRLIF